MITKEKLRECQRRYRESPKGKEAKKRYNKKYNQKYKKRIAKYNKEYNKRWRKTTKGKAYCQYINTRNSQTITGKYSTYQANARRRFLLWDIVFKDFKTFWQQPCFYCGQEIKTIGLDRKYNDEGYNLNNVVPCCTKCNRMKSTLSIDDFINHCRKIIGHHNHFE